MLVVGGFISGTMSTRGLGSYMAVEEFMTASMSLKQMGMNFSLASSLTTRFSLTAIEGEIEISTLDIEWEAPKQPYARITMKYIS